MMRSFWRFFFILFSLASAAETLYIPADDSTFILFSPSGIVRFVPTDRKWRTSLQIKTSGRGGIVQVKTGETGPFSLKDRTLVLWLKITDIDEMEELWLYAAGDSDFENRVVYMISDDKTQLIESKWLKVSLPPTSGKIRGIPDLSDMKYFQFRLKDRGRDPYCLEAGPIYTEANQSPGTAVFTFDDGWESQHSVAAPLLKEFGYSATAYIIPERVGYPGYMDAAQLISLEDDFNWSLGSHYQERLDGKTAAELEVLFSEQMEYFEGLGISVRDFSYPNGRISSALLETVPRYFSSARTIVEFPESSPPGDPYRLRTVNIVPGFSIERIREHLESAVRNGELVIFIFHKITGKSQVETELAADDFRLICRAVKKSGINVTTMARLSQKWTELGALTAPPVGQDIPVFQKKTE